MSDALQNRSTPDGQLVADRARGTMMGNRGGRIHDPLTKMLLPKKRWASKAWITCVTDFRGRHRAVWGHSYTELFFLDEVTALAAGHRPCFECRRKDAMRYAAFLARSEGLTARMRAGEMDRRLHRERTGKRTDIALEDAGGLPDGAMLKDKSRDTDGSIIIAKKGSQLLRWSFEGYQKISAKDLGERPQILTPPTTLKVLHEGFEPLWHPSANQLC